MLVFQQYHGLASRQQWVRTPSGWGRRLMLEDLLDYAWAGWFRFPFHPPPGATSESVLMAPLPAGLTIPTLPLPSPHLLTSSVVYFLH